MHALLFLLALSPSVHAGDTAPGFSPDPREAKALAKARTDGVDVQVALPRRAEALQAGAATYASRCTVCHGAESEGDGTAAVALHPAPADFTDVARWDATSSGLKRWIIANGIAGTGMAPMGLSGEQATDVLAYIEVNFAQH